MQTPEMQDLVDDIMDGLARITDGVTEIEVQADKTQQQLKEILEQRENIEQFLVQLFGQMKDD